MTNTSEAPADTTMMRIVHDALRRDLARARAALSGTDTSGPQLRAIGAHLLWLMDFLHAHHASEDDGLYPFVRQRADAAALQVIDRMAGDHAMVAAASAEVEKAATALVSGASDGVVHHTLDALDALTGALLPHLRSEEDEAMPIVSRLISAAEWQVIEKKHNLDPKSKAQLGFEGHWLIDDASSADRATVLGLVPPIPRVILLHGFARRYRRHVARCWGQGAKPPRRVQLQNTVAVVVDADIDAVWDVVRDVTRIGDWSHECVSASWLGRAAIAVPGARFRGRNRARLLRWGRVCEVVSAQPYALVWRTVPTLLFPDSTEWSIRLETVDGGTRISQDFRVVRGTALLAVIYAFMVPTHRDRTAELTRDLERLGAAARAT